MTGKLFAVSGCTMAFDDANVGGVITLTGTPSAKVKAGGAGVLKHGFGIQVTNVTYAAAGATIPDPGPFAVSFAATATKNKADGALVLRVDDQTAVINAAPKVPGSPPTPHPISFRVKITAAGQTKVSGL